MDINVELHPKSGELRPQHNLPGGPTTRENVLEFDPDDHTLVNIRIDTVQYGKYNGEAAALILLRFILKFRPGYKRIRSFNVNAEFSSVDAGDTANASLLPKVLSLAPESGLGRVFMEEAWIEPSVGGTANTDSNAQKLLRGGDGTKIFDKDHDFTFNGWKKSSKSQVDNVVVWDCVEGKKAARGVIPAYRGVVIVQFVESTSFQADFRLRADVGTFNLDKRVFDWLDLFGNRKDDPVIFNPSEPVGRQFSSLDDFKELKLDEFTRLDTSHIPILEGQEPAIKNKPKQEVGRNLKQKNTGADKVFRIRNVPAAFSASDIEQIVCKQTSSSLLIASLAPEADSFNRDQYRVATAIFKPLEAPFRDLQPGQKVRCNYTNSSDHERSLLIDCSFLGLTTLASPRIDSAILMDLVAVTGLNGHPLASWKEQNGSYVWIRDGLPDALPNARILTYGYDSKLIGSASFASVSNYGKSLLTELQAARAKPEETRSQEIQRPLVFIGHSLGGLLIKEALVHSSRADPHGKNLFSSTRGLFFLGVPHRGLRIEHLLAMVESQPNKEFVQSLKPESSYLYALHENFVHVAKEKNLTIHTYFETVESPTAKRVGDTWKLEGPPQRLVSQSSATGATPYEDPSHQHPMNCTHSEMAKFDENNPNYKSIRSLLIGISQSLTSN